MVPTKEDMDMAHDARKDNAIKALYEKYGDRTPNALRSKENKALKEYLFGLYPMLQTGDYTDGMRVYWLLSGLDDFPDCGNALHGRHKNATHKCRITGYETEYCCAKCAHEAGYAKTLKSKEERYGDANWNNAERRAKTNIDRYGCANAAQNPDVIRRIQAKRREKIDGLMAKAWRTRKESSPEKYAEFRYWDKLFLQFLDEHGVTGFEPRHYSKREKIELRFKVKSYEKMKEKGQFKPDFGLDAWIANKDPFRNEMDWVCPEGHKFRSTMKTHYAESLRCPVCDPYLDVGTSKIEKEMQRFLNEMWPHPEADRNRRDVIKPLELDDFIADKNTAFELDGLYTHCDLNKKNGYHQMKTKMCRAKGIRLVHVFEDEWNDRRAICESYMKNTLGLGRMLDTRELRVEAIGVAEFEEFASRCCIDLRRPGECCACYGLYEGDALAWATGFRRVKANKYEMDRPCPALGLDVPNAIDTVLPRFVEEFGPVYVSLALDRRWFDESAMSHVGSMRLAKRTRSAFYYVNYGYSRRYRPEEMTRELLSGLKRYDPAESVERNIELCRFAKIYDCGALVYVWKRKDRLEGRSFVSGGQASVT